MLVLITGAGRGIGRVVALAYAKERAFLALCARTESEITETIESAEVLGAVPPAGSAVGRLHTPVNLPSRAHPDVSKRTPEP